MNNFEYFGRLLSHQSKAHRQQTNIISSLYELSSVWKRMKDGLSAHRSTGREKIRTAAQHLTSLSCVNDNLSDKDKTYFVSCKWLIFPQSMVLVLVGWFGGC